MAEAMFRMCVYTCTIESGMAEAMFRMYVYTCTIENAKLQYTVHVHCIKHADYINVIVPSNNYADPVNIVKCLFCAGL